MFNISYVSTKFWHVIESCIHIHVSYNKTEINFEPLRGFQLSTINLYQRTNGPVNAHLISWPSKAQNIQNLENIW